MINKNRTQKNINNKHKTKKNKVSNKNKKNTKQTSGTMSEDNMLRRISKKIWKKSRKSCKS